MPREPCHTRRTAAFSDGKLPTSIDDGLALWRVRFDTCSESLLSMQVHRVVDRTLDDRGVPKDAWWAISDAAKLPERYCRLRGGAAVERMLSSYGLIDGNGCLNSGSGTCEYADWCGVDVVPSADDDDSDGVWKVIGDRMGVPQRLENSGNCWFSAVCFALFLNDELREHIAAHLPRKLAELCGACLQDPAAAEELRKRLWFDYAFGDKWGQNPALDGQNGAAQVCVLAAQTGLPVARFFVDDEGAVHRIRKPVVDQRGNHHALTHAPSDPRDPHVLMFRFHRGEHGTDARKKPARRVTYRPPNEARARRYRLVSMLIGSEHCGHQISAAAPTRSWRSWAFADSDQRRHGIGPMCFRVSDEDMDAIRVPSEPRPSARDKWWQIFRMMNPVTYFSRGYCDLSPHNLPSDAIQRTDPSQPHGGTCQYRKSGGGMVNVDFVYFSCGHDDE